MYCPFCRHPDSRVIDSRAAHPGALAFVHVAEGAAGPDAVRRHEHEGVQPLQPVRGDRGDVRPAPPAERDERDTAPDVTPE